MKIKVGINGFGRMGHLILKILWERNDVSLVHINDPSGDASIHAHLLNFDSVHGRWRYKAKAIGNNLVINDQHILLSQHKKIEDTDWSDCDIIIEASGRIKKKEQAQAYLDQGVKRVVVTAPMEDEEVLNIVMGVNDHQFDPKKHSVITAASCTTNCLAPIVKVIHENLRIKHGTITTIHSVTNTQPILDAPISDLRRARAGSLNMIPTTTGAASAIARIFPELKGKLNGLAVRVPLANASLTDAVFEVEKPTTSDEVNRLFKDASENELKNILGFEELPLVSSDFKTDPRSSIIDALSTMVIDGTQVKIYSWYDNEWGYSNRCVELVCKTGHL